jgi:tetratricopeptide (TPR) repeat protein
MTPEELNEALEHGTLNEAATQLEHQRAEALGRGDVHGAAELSNDLGVVFFLAGRYPDADTALQRARDGFLQVNDSLGEARALGNLARLEEKKGDRQVAVGMYRQAADLFDAAKEYADEFATLRTLSQLYLKLGGWLQALATFDRALMIKPHRGLMEAFLHMIYQIPLRMLGIGTA